MSRAPSPDVAPRGADAELAEFEVLTSAAHVFFSYQGNGKVDHVSVINAVRGGVPFYAQHTTAAWNRSIHKGLHGHPDAEVYIAHVTG